MWLLTNNIDSHSIEYAIYNVYKHRVLRLRSTDWKSSLRRVFNLSMYITNITPHGKCFVRCYTLVVLYQKSHSFASLTCSISDPPQLMCNQRTRAFSMKYSTLYNVIVRHDSLRDVIYIVTQRQKTRFSSGR